MTLGELVSVTYIIEDYLAQRKEGNADEIANDPKTRKIYLGEQFKM